VQSAFAQPGEQDDKQQNGDRCEKNGHNYRRMAAWQS
jgi:hypothetical protein